MRIRYILAILLIFLVCSGFTFIGGRPPSGGGDYLVDEDFEGTGTPTSATWSSSGSFNYDYTTTTLEGTESVYIDMVSNIDMAEWVPDGATDHVRVTFLAEFPDLALGSEGDFDNMIKGHQDDDSSCVSLYWEQEANNEISFRINVSGAGYTSSTNAISEDTTYEMQLDFYRSGVNGVGEFRWKEQGASSWVETITSSAENSDGPWTKFHVAYDCPVMILDKFRVIEDPT
jgi:hypothetical protein